MKFRAGVDWLGEMQTALVAALVVTGAAGLFSVLGPLTAGSVEVEVPAKALGGTDGLPSGVALAEDATVLVRIEDPTPAQFAWNLMTTLPTLLVITAMLTTLLLVVRTARRDDPFSATAVRRLRLLAVLGLTGIAAGAVESLAAVPLSEGASGGEAFWFHWDLGLLWLLPAFGFLALAEVFNRGRVMRDELSEVI